MRSCCVALLALSSLAPVAMAETTYTAPRHHRYVVRHRRHPIRKTFKRVGIGAAGGAGVGALIGGGPGAAIGALAGGAAGAIYDGHEKYKKGE
jgi:uncharacterized protein YcfJ